MTHVTNKPRIISPYNNVRGYEVPKPLPNGEYPGYYRSSVGALVPLFPVSSPYGLYTLSERYPD